MKNQSLQEQMASVAKQMEAMKVKSPSSPSLLEVGELSGGQATFEPWKAMAATLLLKDPSFALHIGKGSASLQLGSASGRSNLARSFPTMLETGGTNMMPEAKAKLKACEVMPKACAAMAKFTAMRNSPPRMALETPAGWEAVELWSPDKRADIRIEGGKTLRTWKMPPNSERVQYILQSPGGRPLKAKVELWIGPIRCVHEMIYDAFGVGSFPLKATLQFKKGVDPVLKMSTNGEFEFPLQVGVFVPSPEESEEIGEITTDMFYSAPMKEHVQGGSTIDGKGGAIRSFAIPTEWEKTQIMVWSKDVGRKSFKTNIEVLQGPNNPKQHINLRCGGSTQPYHAVIETPGPGWTIRCNSKKYLEDGKFEIALAPYGELGGDNFVPVMGGPF